MGWKASMILIEDRKKDSTDEDILKALGKEKFKYQSDTILDDCLYPRDQSINIGRYKGNIIICEDYQITEFTLEKASDLTILPQEQKLVDRFPHSEIITVACHSTMNYHGYSIIQDGIKKRLKLITADSSRFEVGNPISEENRIYSTAHEQEGTLLWKDENDPEESFTEDQLMEDFTFEIAKRRLGVRLDTQEGDELMENVVFKKYWNPKVEDPIKKEKKKDWLPYILALLGIIAWQVFKRWLRN